MLISSAGGVPLGKYSSQKGLIALGLAHLVKVKEDGDGGAVGRAKVGLDREVHRRITLLQHALQPDTGSKPKL